MTQIVVHIVNKRNPMPEENFRPHVPISELFDGIPASSQTEQTVPESNPEPAEPIQTHTRIQIRLAMARRLRDKLETGQFKPEEELDIIKTIDSLTREGEKRPKKMRRAKKKLEAKKTGLFD